MPWKRLPPRCGQRLLSAKNSPPRLNTTTARPFTSTSLRVPGGNSSSEATTWLVIRADFQTVSSAEPVERVRVAGKDLGATLLVERRRHGLERIVEIPVRVIGREHDVIPADPVHHFDEVCGLLGFFHR